jgi:hypothetical protein
LEIRVLNPASEEIDEAFQYYEEDLEGIGYRFIIEVLEGFERIKSNPTSWSPFSKNTRRCLLNTFPFGLIYQLAEDEIIIVAVANLNRKPLYWKERI